jgi:hypothetical protein
MKRVGAGAARVLYTGAKPTRPGQASRVWCGAPPRRSRLRWRVGQQGAGTGGCCVAADVAGAPNPWVGMDRAANGRLPRRRFRAQEQRQKSSGGGVRLGCRLPEPGDDVCSAGTGIAWPQGPVTRWFHGN